MTTINTNDFFYLHHKATDSLVEKLNWTQLHGFCRMIRAEDYPGFFVWIQEQDKWIHLPEVIETILGKEAGFLRYPPKPPEEIDGYVVKHQLIEAATERRQYKRYKKAIEVKVDVEGRLVPVQTMDVSLGGLQIEKTLLTKGRPKYILMYHKTNGEMIEFKASPKYTSDKLEGFDRAEFISCSNLKLWKQIVEG